MNANICAACVIFLGVTAYGAPETPTPEPGGVRFKFQAYDGDPQIPAKMEFQLNPLTKGDRTEFVKLGDIVAGTKLKVVSFKFKEAKGANGEREDVSELTLRDMATGEAVVLQVAKIINSK